MKATARSILSAVTGLGLTAFTVISAFNAGFNGATTVVAFSLLAIYGLLEIALISYTAPRFVRLPERTANEANDDGQLLRIGDYAGTRSDADRRRAA